MSHQEAHDFQELINKCDQLMKAGSIHVVEQHLSALNFAQVPRAFRSPLAKICRRAGLIGIGLRLLQPLVRDEKQNTVPPTPTELCEYAVLLSRNGSVAEALGVLEEVNSDCAPEAFLYRAFCHISNWDYAVAIGFLESFLTTETDDYTKLIARVNLAAAYVITGESTDALATLLEAMDQAHKLNAQRLIGNCLELKAQLYVQKGNFDLARSSLNAASTIFTASGSYDQLMIQKWESIMASIETKDTNPLLHFRAKAQIAEHWESVRESDLFLSSIRFQQNDFDHLVFGTPMAAYRKRIQKTVPARPSESYTIGSSVGPLLRLATGEVFEEKARSQSTQTRSTSDISLGKKVHQCLLALTQDFYQPRNLGTLFSDLYPEEYFDVNSSALRVRQWIHRTREWLKKEALPITIENTKGSYHLAITGNCAIELKLDRPVAVSNDLKLNVLMNHFADTTFTADQACKKLNISKSSFHRLAKWAEEKGELKKSGQARSTVHQIQKKSA